MKIAVDHVSKFYGRFRALDDITFDIQKGSSVALLGSNGAGKTTLLRCMLGLIKFSGRIQLDDLDVARDGSQVRNRIAYLPQVTSFYPGMSVLETLRFFVDTKGVSDSKIQPSLKFAGLENFGESDVNSLSTGMKQRLVLSIALLSDPEAFYFDEPTANLDIRAQLEFKSLMSSLLGRGKTILMATHILGGIDGITDRLLLLDRGKLIADKEMKVLMSDSNFFGHLYLKMRKEDLELATRTISKLISNKPSARDDWLVVPSNPADWQKILRTIDGEGIEILEFKAEEPELEDVFLRLTGERRES